MERQGVCLALLLVSVSVLFIESRASNDAVSHVGLDWQEADALNTFLGLPEDEDEDEQSESPSDGDISHIRPPTFMLRMYEWRKQREKMLADFARAFTYGPAALCATPELTTIRSYPFKGEKLKCEEWSREHDQARRILKHRTPFSGTIH